MNGVVQFGDVGVSRLGHVAVVELQRPPDNSIDVELVGSIADAFESLEADPTCRAIVLCSAGKHFCAGARLGGTSDPLAAAAALGHNPLYTQAVRLFEGSIPVIAAIQGAAIGAGVGLALVADIRVTCSEARFAVNFSQLGFHPGFGISFTLPRLIGEAHAMDLMYTGRRITGDEALAIGLCERLVSQGDVRATAIEIAMQIASSAPLAVRAIRRTLRSQLAAQVKAATDHEHSVQSVLRATEDYDEGVKAYAERRPADFQAR
ncbi:MAG: enoyl-CoA hydratase/isomerase family protein [Actinobacteria bacterium]|uniref:Unannotated protein n=1 Tax=freshwater metagenome TaxID=449393 RepID=A0A6J6AB89_9ZZZZ|nr:enoyl-CoA hydratase/isomerase family protein [Actinomycetota bacterium]MSW78777.1 enoyl-CoA hydratase/isomerase family protein [Actinomycetota bacterium]MSX55189.1 enoyl-CoA hydratase/isomerase family protein [Actinomycetota bacterium]MSZ84934.1 enoyl-CoA hydratase/isomerase family protein [Actinomycetota bacterium]MTB19482.1 enoyl-CoA hydratase/isomerase family protein [Actinomycetota bacterium]